MHKFPIAQEAFDHTLEKVLKTTRQEVETFGYEVAAEMHAHRSNVWIERHQFVSPADNDEAVAIVCFASVLQFVNLLLATREL